jgi:hypothetical protein
VLEVQGMKVFTEVTVGGPLPTTKASTNWAAASLQKR